MLRRLLLGYIGLTLVVLVAFGVPFGILWSGKVRSDELGALGRAAADAARLVAPPLNHSLGIDDMKSTVSVRLDVLGGRYALVHIVHKYVARIVQRHISRRGQDSH